MEALTEAPYDDEELVVLAELLDPTVDSLIAITRGTSSNATGTVLILICGSVSSSVGESKSILTSFCPKLC